MIILHHSQLQGYLSYMWLSLTCGKLLPQDEFPGVNSHFIGSSTLCPPKGWKYYTVVPTMNDHAFPALAGPLFRGYLYARTGWEVW